MSNGEPKFMSCGTSAPSNGIIPLSNSFNPQFRPERIQLPKVDQWNVAVQQQFGANTTFEIAYVGNHAERIYPGETYGYDLNAPVLPSSPAEIASGDIATRRPFFNKFVSTYKVGEPKPALRGELACVFVIEQARISARGLAVEFAVARGGRAHALHHHVEEQRFELLRRFSERCIWIFGSCGLEIAECPGIDCETGDVHDLVISD